MKTKVIDLLNKAVAEELYAINQYMYFHFHCDDQGYDILAALFKKIAIDEMKHLEEFAERILFLKGEVNMIPSSDVKKITNVKEMLELSRKLENEAMEDYNKMAIECANNNDAVTKTIFEEITKEGREWMEELNERNHQERLQNKYFKQQRILNSKEDKRIFYE